MGNVIDEFCVPTEGPHRERGFQKPNMCSEMKNLVSSARPNKTHGPVAPRRASPQPDFPPLKQALLMSAFFLEDCYDKIPEGRGHTDCVCFSACLSPDRKPSPKGAHCRHLGRFRV